MKEERKLITLQFDGKKKENDPYKRCKDAMMVRKYMEFRDNGLLYESLFPVGIKYHPDIYYDFESYMWRAILPNGELCQGDLRSMVRMFMGMDIRYHYEVSGEERAANLLEMVVRDAVENPESFSIMGFQEEYSYQEWTYLNMLCQKLIESRNGDRYQCAKMAEWMNG